MSAGWGASEFYSAAQIRAALERCDLGGRYVGVAYAAYLSEPDYLAIASGLPVVLPYDIARDAFERARPAGDAFSATRDAEMKSAPMISRDSL